MEAGSDELRGRELTPEEAAHRVVAEGETVVIPVIREQWEVRKEVRETGAVRVSKAVRQREETISDTLAAEIVQVERVPMDQVVESAPPVRIENGVTIVSIVREFPVLVKQLRVVEEVRIRRQTIHERFDHTVQLQGEEVQVQRLTPEEMASGAADDAGSADAWQFRETREEAVVRTEPWVVEEIEISKESTEREATLRDTLKQTVVEVEPLVPGAMKKPAGMGR